MVLKNLGTNVSYQVRPESIHTKTAFVYTHPTQHYPEKRCFSLSAWIHSVTCDAIAKKKCAATNRLSCVGKNPKCGACTKGYKEFKGNCILLVGKYADRRGIRMQVDKSVVTFGENEDVMMARTAEHELSIHVRAQLLLHKPLHTNSLMLFFIFPTSRLMSKSTAMSLLRTSTPKRKSTSSSRRRSRTL